MTQEPRTAQFSQDRFGMFIHFGPYSVAGRHEWVRNHEELDVEQYQKYVDHFDADLFDARAIAATAKNAGCRYAVLTTKHHDGYCLWDSALTDYTSQAYFGRDLVREYVDALREAGLHVGLYYSLLDWHHPDYTIDPQHPLRNRPDVAELNAAKDWGTYREYLHGQVRELLTNYGQIDYLFFDFTNSSEIGGLKGKTAKDWDAESLLAMCRELQPGMVINDRTGIPADVTTPEQYQPVSPVIRDGKAVTWEACQTINGSWGYHRDNLDHKPADLLVRMLVDSVAKGGNLILNVGPNGRGEIAPHDAQTFAQIGEWMRLHSASVYGCGPAGFAEPNGAIYTRSRGGLGNRIYVHVTTWPFHHLHLPGLAGKISFARLLNDGSEVQISAIQEDESHDSLSPIAPPPGTATLTLPLQRPDVLLPVVELTLEEGN
ncbi:MAG: alpha-L-fucosidase [Propionibacteriaceae bacterium]|jgi:alpha-L-fucosidase|nr:alpha-L-fucosidase [Propionibacteriaceae bacterium]